MNRFTLATAFALSASIANATVFIDFTDTNQWSGTQTSQMYGGLIVDLVTNPANAQNFLAPIDTPQPYCTDGTLACDTGGLSVQGVEITNQDTTVTPPLESVTLQFNKEVIISKLYFLDLYVQAGNVEKESAKLYVNGDRTNQAAEFVQDDDIEIPELNGFLAVEGLNIMVTGVNPLTGKSEITFFPGEGNDFPPSILNDPDFNLAGIQLEVIPVPPAAALFVTALAGFGFLRRKTKA